MRCRPTTRENEKHNVSPGLEINSLLKTTEDSIVFANLAEGQKYVKVGFMALRGRFYCMTRTKCSQNMCQYVTMNTQIPHTHANKGIHLHLSRTCTPLCVCIYASPPVCPPFPSCVCVFGDWPLFTNLLALPKSYFWSQRKLYINVEKPGWKFLLHRYTVGGGSSGSPVAPGNRRLSDCESRPSTSGNLQLFSVTGSLNVVRFWLRVRRGFNIRIQCKKSAPACCGASPAMRSYLSARVLSLFSFPSATWSVRSHMVSASSLWRINWTFTILPTSVTPVVPSQIEERFSNILIVQAASEHLTDMKNILYFLKFITAACRRQWKSCTVISQICCRQQPIYFCNLTNERY